MVKKGDTKSPSASDPTACKPSRKPIDPASAEKAPPQLKPFNLDLKGLNLVRPPKFPVGTTVPERVYLEILGNRSGISQFLEDAITGFDGDMRALVEAANQLSEERRTARFDTGVRAISGRVSRTALTRLQEILAALKDIRGMSVAKILGGLVLLQLATPDG
jgi:hypothetical protein